MDMNGVPIAGYEGQYLISKQGKVWSVPRGRYLSTHLNRGYVQIALRKDGKTRTLKVHRLVALTFLSPVEGRSQVNHKNGNKSDNDADNLEWVNEVENKRHALGYDGEGLNDNTALKMFSRKGGITRSQRLTPERRSEIARMGALAKRDKRISLDKLAA